MPLTWRATTRLFDAVATAHPAGPALEIETDLQPQGFGCAPEFTTQPSRRGAQSGFTGFAGLAGLGHEIRRRAARRLLLGPDWPLPASWGSWRCTAGLFGAASGTGGREGGKG